MSTYSQELVDMTRRETQRETRRITRMETQRETSDQIAINLINEKLPYTDQDIARITGVPLSRVPGLRKQAQRQKEAGRSSGAPVQS